MSETAALPAQLSELDRLKLQLSKEKQMRLQTEAMNVQMMMRSVEAQMKALDAEQKPFFDYLKSAYQLAPADQIAEDGTITRAPVRAVPPPETPKPAELPKSA